MSVTYRSTCRPTLGRYIERDVSVNIASDISVDTSADMSVDMSTDTSRSTHWPRVGQYVDRHIGRASVEMLTDISVEGFVNYTWSRFVFHFSFLRVVILPFCDSPCRSYCLFIHDIYIMRWCFELLKKSCIKCHQVMLCSFANVFSQSFPFCSNLLLNQKKCFSIWFLN